MKTFATISALTVALWALAPVAAEAASVAVTNNGVYNVILTEIGSARCRCRPCCRGRRYIVAGGPELDDCASHLPGNSPSNALSPFDKDGNINTNVYVGPG